MLVEPCLSTANSCRYSIKRAVDVIFARAVVASAPSCINFRVAGPSDGSVTFCDATAPTPACAHEHLAATAGDEDEIAMPNMPVSLQRATRENVTVITLSD